MYSVLPELYLETAVRLCEAVDSENYFSGSIVFHFAEEIQCRLTTSVIICREPLRLPEGTTNAIADLVPVWWEFHTTGDQGEWLNDFDFTELKKYIL